MVRYIDLDVQDKTTVLLVQRKARENGFTVSDADFERIDGELTIDGMDPLEWIEAMTMD